MKKTIYPFLICFYFFVNNLSAQEDKTTFNDKDTFTYKRIEILDKEEGKMSIIGGKAEHYSNTDTNIATRSASDSGIGETPGHL